MPRLGRYFVPEQPLHLIQRGHSRQPVFFSAEDAQRYRAWLAEAAAEQGCAVHAYVLMPNHVHLLLTPVHGDSLPRLMQSLGRRYVRAVNAAHGRSGSLWEGRYRAAPIDPVHLVDCCRYIELNPARAGMVRHARQHRWSSYRGNALGEADPVLVPHARQIALGVAAYRALCERPLEAGFIAAVRAATNGGWALGDAAFQARIAAATGRRAAPLPRGRPRKIAPAAATGASIDE